MVHPSESETVLAGRYRLDRKLALGGMAEVWLATDLYLDRVVAVKVLKQQLAGDATAIERFRREARIVAQLDHPNIVSIYDSVEHDGRQAVVMPFVPGKSLRDLLDAEKHLSPEQTLNIAASVAGALDAAHRAKEPIIHRDVKPGNILITPDGHVLLALTTGGDTPRGAAVEIKRGSDGKPDEIVWRYDGTQDEVNSIQKTPEGTYVLSEAGPNPRLLELAADGSIKAEMPLDCQKKNHHMQTRMARKQPDGTYLVPHLLDFAIKRYDAAGKVVATIDTRVPGEPKVNSWPFTAIALADGGILAGLTNGNRVAEYAPDGKLRWEITTADVDGAIADACGIQRSGRQ